MRPILTRPCSDVIAGGVFLAIGLRLSFYGFFKPRHRHALNDVACVVRSLLRVMFPPFWTAFQSTIPDTLRGFCRRRVCLFCSLRRAVLVVAVFVYAHRVERSTPGGGRVCRCFLVSAALPQWRGGCRLFVFIFFTHLLYHSPPGLSILY